MIPYPIMGYWFHQMFARIALPIAVLSSALCWTTQSDGATIIAAGDSYIQGGANAGNNYGTSTSITVKYTGTGVTDTSRIGYLYFEVGSLLDPIGSASLNLTPTTNNTDVGSTPWTVQIYALANESLDNWIESGAGSITWNNSPGHDAGSTSFNSDAIYLGDLSVPAGITGTSYSFSNQALVDFLNTDTDGRVTFMLTRTSTPSSGFNLGFASKEHANLAYRPSLTYEAVPEPGRMVLAALSGIAFLMTRRRGHC